MQGEPVVMKTLTVADFSQYSPIFMFSEVRTDYGCVCVPVDRMWKV